MSDRDPAEVIAKLFHETYERLAPEHGYETRESSAVPWSEVPEPNRRLMIATCREVLVDDRLRAFLAERDAEWRSLLTGHVVNANAANELVVRLRGQLAALRSAMAEVVAKCPACGGEGVERGPDPGESFGPNRGLDFPCRWCAEVRAALATDAGRLEAEVLRAVTSPNFVRWLEIRLDVPTQEVVYAIRALQAAKETP